jgi:hypothetical protein
MRFSLWKVLAVAPSPGKHGFVDQSGSIQGTFRENSRGSTRRPGLNMHQGKDKRKGSYH